MGGRYELQLSGGNAAQLVEFMIWKDKKDALGNAITPSADGPFDATAGVNELSYKKYGGWYRKFQFSTNGDKCVLRFSIPRKLKGRMDEGDVIKFGIFNGSGATVTYSLHGKCLTRK